MGDMRVIGIYEAIGRIAVSYILGAENDEEM
jgi:hypothetical protein